MAFHLLLELDLPLELAPYLNWVYQKFELELELLAKSAKKS